MECEILSFGNLNFVVANSFSLRRSYYHSLIHFLHCRLHSGLKTVSISWIMAEDNEEHAGTVTYEELANIECEFDDVELEIGMHFSLSHCAVHVPGRHSHLPQSVSNTL